MKSFMKLFPHRFRKFILFAQALCLGLLLSASIFAQSPSNNFSFNAESVTYFTKPLAYEYQGGVIEIDNAIAAGYRSELNGDSTYDQYQLASRLRYLTQLDNDWDVSFSYLGSYDNERFNSYQDIVRVAVKDQWGEVILGNISAVVFERTNRQQATGLFGINDDSFTLPLKRTGLFYQWQTPQLQLMFAVDREANIELGASYYAIIQGNEMTLSARLNNIENTIADAQGVGESQAIALVAQIQRGRWIADAQFQHEKLAFLANQNDFELNSVSAGLHYSFNRWQWSLSGISKDNELDDTERTIALGIRYDIARGLTLNLGKSVNNSKLFPERFHSYGMSLQYEF